jgi:hydrophobe/amphiphile efflux-1 (HAE1) family protein
MNVSAPFIVRPIATSLLMAAVLLLGLVAYFMLPVSALPQVDFPTVQVSASLPGASPETMASSVATPLERQFAQIPGVGQMTSTSSLGVTSITLQFDLNRNIDAAAQDVQAAINAAGGQLPKNLPSPPTYRKTNPADQPILIMTASSDSLPIAEVDDYAENILAQQFSQIAGVSQVFVAGQQKPAVRVQLNPAQLAAMGIGLEDARAVIGNATVDAPKGSFDGQRQAFTLYANDQILKAKDYNDLVIAYRNGAPVKIADVGRAIDDVENNKLAAWSGNKRAILLFVQRQPGANVIETADNVKAAIPRLVASMPPAIHLEVISDRTQTIRASLSDVQFTLMLTIALVVMVIFVFLRKLWATVIPSVAVPLSLVGAFGAMYMLGYSLDNLSLMALTIAVGFVVDDAIVMIENVVRYIEEGETPLQAALKGSAEIGFTIVSMSLSLIAVFIPLLLMGGVVGRLFREFAVTVSVTIVISGLVSLTLTPMMCAVFLKHEPPDQKHNRLYNWTERGFDAMLAFYDRTLKIVLRHHVLTMLSLLATVAATVYLYIDIPKGFFPQQDTGNIFGQAEAAQDISFKGMAERQKALLDVILKDPDIASVGSYTGTTAFNPALNLGRIFISLRPKSERKASAEQVIARLRPEVAKVQGIAFFMQAAQDLNVGGRLSRTQYQYTLQDANLAELIHWSPIMLDKLKSLPQLQDVATDQQSNGPTVNLTIDRATASRFGIQPQLIDDTLYDAFGQRQVAQYFTQLNQYHVILEVDPAYQLDPSSLNKIYLKSPLTGQQVPLSSFVQFESNSVNYLSISHQGQFPAVTLSFNLSPGTALGDAVKAITKAEREVGKPATLAGSFQGSAQAFQSSLASQPYLIAAALIVVYIILGILYESYIHPITILSTLPSAGVGALITLKLFGYDLSVIALIGIILLIGIVKKNAIMMIDFALEAERKRGMSPEESIYQACLLRFRPIMMTTMAALLGAAPLALGTGTGSELRQPLGYAVVGGLILSQMLTLYTTPVVYLYLDRVNNWLSGPRAENRARKTGQTRPPRRQHAAE